MVRESVGEFVIRKSRALGFSHVDMVRDEMARLCIEVQPERELYPGQFLLRAHLQRLLESDLHVYPGVAVRR